MVDNFTVAVLMVLLSFDSAVLKEFCLLTFRSVEFSDHRCYTGEPGL